MADAKKRLRQRLGGPSAQPAFRPAIAPPVPSFPVNPVAGLVDPNLSPFTPAAANPDIYAGARAQIGNALGSFGENLGNVFVQPFQQAFQGVPTIEGMFQSEGLLPAVGAFGRNALAGLEGLSNLLVGNPLRAAVGGLGQVEQGFQGKTTPLDAVTQAAPFVPTPQVQQAPPGQVPAKVPTTPPITQPFVQLDRPTGSLPSAPDLANVESLLNAAAPQAPEAQTKKEQLGFILRGLAGGGPIDPMTPTGTLLLDLGLRLAGGKGAAIAAEQQQQAEFEKAARDFAARKAEFEALLQQRDLQNRLSLEEAQNQRISLGNQANLQEARQLAPQSIGGGTVLLKTRKGDTIESTPKTFGARNNDSRILAAGLLAQQNPSALQNTPTFRQIIADPEDRKLLLDNNLVNPFELQRLGQNPNAINAASVQAIMDFMRNTPELRDTYDRIVAEAARQAQLKVLSGSR